MTGLCLPCLCRIAPLPSVIAPLAVLLCECVWGAGAVTGKGAKDVLTDQQAANILARITPSLKDEDYDKVYVTQPLQSAALIINCSTPADLVDVFASAALDSFNIPFAPPADLVLCQAVVGALLLIRKSLNGKTVEPPERPPWYKNPNYLLWPIILMFMFWPYVYGILATICIFILKLLAYTLDCFTAICGCFTAIGAGCCGLMHRCCYCRTVEAAEDGADEQPEDEALVTLERSVALLSCSAQFVVSLRPYLCKFVS